MTFIKSLRTNKGEKGQASLEYFVIFAVVALMTILSFSTFFPKMQAALQGTNRKQGFFQKAALSGLDVDNNGR